MRSGIAAKLYSSLPFHGTVTSCDAKLGNPDCVLAPSSQSCFAILLEPGVCNEIMHVKFESYLICIDQPTNSNTHSRPLRHICIVHMEAQYNELM